MEVEAAPSFFKSLSNIDSWKSKYWEARSWIKHHFNKDFGRLFKTTLKSYPWDWTYLYEIEKAKIIEMRKYHERTQNFVGWERVVRDMKICERLIDIFTGKVDLYHYNGGITFVRNENGNYTMKTSDDWGYVCHVKVNTKNIDRFIGPVKPSIRQYWIDNPHELYIEKAKRLYHKIRYERDEEWWD